MLSSHLQQLLEAKTVAHALLFSGLSLHDLEKIAIDFAKKLLESKGQKIDPLNLRLFYPEGKTGMYSLQTIRQLSEETFLAASTRCFIIHSCERMQSTSSNALLKTLEEPPSQTFFILLTTKPSFILPTLLSRCQKVSIPSQHLQETQIEEKLLSFMSFPNSFAFEEIAYFLEEKKKAWEKEIEQKALSEAQKEGALVVKMQQEVTQIFTVVLKWFRDRSLVEWKVDSAHIHYSSHIEGLKKTRYIPFLAANKFISNLFSEYQKGMKLETCIEALFLKLF